VFFKKTTENPRNASGFCERRAQAVKSIHHLPVEVCFLANMAR
jgi:hypothetical protein